jgi:hypothetical protein
VGDSATRGTHPQSFLFHVVVAMFFRKRKRQHSHPVLCQRPRVSTACTPLPVTSYRKRLDARENERLRVSLSSRVWVGSNKGTTSGTDYCFRV